MGHAPASVCLFITYYEPVCKDRKPWEGLRWGGWCREKAARPEPGCAAASVRVCACVCERVPAHADEGGLCSRQGPMFSWGLSLPTCMQGSRDHQPLWPHGSVLPPHPGEVSGYCSPAFPSIRILLHSCESFSKQTPACKGEKRAGEGERGGWMQTQPRLLALACSPWMPPPRHACIPGPGPRRALE